MELAQIDLSKIKAIGHDGEQLGILLDRGEGVLEFLTTPAPRQAMFGIQQLAMMAAAGKEVTAPSSDEVYIKMQDVASAGCQEKLTSCDNVFVALKLPLKWFS